MKKSIFLILSILALSVGIKFIFTQEPMLNKTLRDGVRVSPRYVIVDDYKGDSLYRDWYYSRIGTDRGAMGDDNGSYTVDIGGGAAAVTVQSGWAGVWTALNHTGAQNEEIDPNKLLGPYINDPYQPFISGIEVDIIDGSGQFKIELKDKNNGVVAQQSFFLPGGQRTLEFSVTPAANISKLNWLVDGMGYATVDEVRLVIESPDYTTPEAVFLFTYGHLCQCYDDDSGLVRDRARWPVEDCAAVQTIGTFALATAVSWDLGYVTEPTARAIIRKTKATILSLPRHEKGLLPHFLTNGDITEDTEWSSVDTAITLIAEILACQAMGEETSQLEAVLEAIDWNDLTNNGTRSISMGYDYYGQKLENAWDTFGSEALLLALAYCAATGDNNVILEKYRMPPTWDGSGFNDELAALFFPCTGIDVWGNNWNVYRDQAFNNQNNYFNNHNTYEANGLFGLSASEVPEPWTLENEDDIYNAWGIGGHNHTANDGESLVGYPIIAPHYSAMVAAEHQEEFEELFVYLIDNQGIFTPLNNVESFGVDSLGHIRWNSLKGSWNLSLQVLGISRALSGEYYLPYQALNGNDFLNQGFIGIMQTHVVVTSPDGDESLKVGTIHDITWASNENVGNVKIEYSINNGDTWTEIVSSTENHGTYLWTVPDEVSDQCLIKISETDGSPSDISNNVFSIDRIATIPIITVTSPNGGENLVVGSVHDIAWTSEGEIGNVTIEYSTDGGTSWNTIVVSTENDGSYNWNVPNRPSDNCLVRVSEKDEDDCPSDVSNAVFSIVYPLPGSITLMSPNGGESWAAGSPKVIKWTSTGDISSVNIKYSTDNGTTWKTITQATTNSGNYDWLVPYTVSDECLVRVTANDNDLDPKPWDVSDAVFSIVLPATPTIRVTAPNGGEQLVVRSRFTIAWESTGFREDVKIEYSSNGGDEWTVISEAAENNGKYDWVVPDDPSDNCLVRVSNTEGEPSDVSDDQFSIVPQSQSEIRVLSPNGGESWEVGSAQAIKWTCTGDINYVTIEYSTDNGTTWKKITQNTPNNGSFEWTVPDTASDLCLVRVTSNDGDPDPRPSDVSDEVFSIILPEPTIRIISPNGGEQLVIGSRSTIRWYATGTREEVKIQYSSNGGETWNLISDAAENNGEYDWIIPDDPSETCLVRISETDGDPVDVSDAVFSIVPPLSDDIVVTSPNGGESWPVGSLQEIKWTWTGDINNVTIDYSTDNGATWKGIVQTTPNDGSYDWTVPDTVSDECLVRVTANDGDLDPRPSDVSDQVFSIVLSIPGEFRVISPNGGESWEVGSTQPITWIGSGDITNVTIDYSGDNGNTWSTIVSSAENSGTYDWNVPDAVSDECLVRVTANDGSGDPKPADVSDEVFSIVLPSSPGIRVVTPNGGEELVIGTTYEITWFSTNSREPVKIEYSLNGGESWMIITEAAQNDGEYDWNVPDEPSDTCLVRISESDGDPVDVSDSVFSIVQPLPGDLTVLTPNGGENLEVGSEYNISWDCSGLNNVVIEYSVNNGSTWLYIAKVPADNGSYTWVVPGTPSDNCLVRITGADSDENPSDTSDEVFTIFDPSQTFIEVLTPNGGESLSVGVEYYITWASAGINKVFIEYSPDYGDQWFPIDTVLAKGGRYTWVVPDTPSEGCLIRITGADSGDDPSDVSDAVFSIISD